MSKINKAVSHEKIYTHEGAVAQRISPYMQLRRSVCSYLLWENEFYEDGESIAERIADLCHKVPRKEVAILAYEARKKFKLRHVSLILLRELARDSWDGTANAIEEVIQRPDELTEFLAIYWKEGRCPVSAQVKKGLAAAFTKFNAYQLAKYNRDEAIKLRDVLFLCHAKPKDAEQAEVWKKLANKTLESPDTWEVNLSAGKDKKETWERLLKENKLGALAFLRNLRNMQSVGVDILLIKDKLMSVNTDKILPFRFITAAKYSPNLEYEIENLMLRCTNDLPKLNGRTALLVDHSGSMRNRLSERSEVTRFDAAGAVGAILREICVDEFRLFTFSDYCVEVPPRRGFAMIDAVKHVINPQWTLLGKAVNFVYDKFPNCERLIVITDEQSADQPTNPKGKGYIINVASAQNGIGYGAWKHIDGFSEAVINWIMEYEGMEKDL